MRRFIDLEDWTLSFTKRPKGPSGSWRPEQRSGHDQSTRAFRAPAIGVRSFERFCKTFFTFYSPLTIEGCDNLPQEPFLLCSNHSSHADSAALMTASGRSFDSFALLGASDYFFYSRSIRWMVSPWMNVIPIDRKPGPKALAACLATCRQFIQETGGNLILYPEGSRSPDGVIRSFRPGIGLFATELALPIVPAFIEGTHEILPKGRSLPRRGPVRVKFGKALTFSKLQWKENPRDLRRSVVAKLAQSVQDLGSPKRSDKSMGASNST